MKRILGIGKPSPNRPPPKVSNPIDVVDRTAVDVRAKIAQCDADLVGLKEQISRYKSGSGAHSALMEKAKRILARKKNYQSLEGNLEQQSFTMEVASSAIQSASMSNKIVSAMKSSVKKLEKTNKKMHLDEIEDLRERMDDFLEISDGVQEALGRNFPGIAEIDEDQLEAELEEIVLDDDTTYLDEATQNPRRPSTSGGVRNKRRSPEPIRNSNGILVDEFGLPIVETHEPGNV